MPPLTQSGGNGRCVIDSRLAHRTLKFAVDVPALQNFDRKSTKHKTGSHVQDGPHLSDTQKAIDLREYRESFSTFKRVAQSEMNALYRAMRDDTATAPLAARLRRPAAAAVVATKLSRTVFYHPRGTQRIQRFPKGFVVAEIHGNSNFYYVIPPGGGP